MAGEKRKKNLKRERKNQFYIHTCNSKGSLSQRQDVAIEIFCRIVCTDQNCTCIIMAQLC